MHYRLAVIKNKGSDSGICIMKCHAFLCLIHHKPDLVLKYGLKHIIYVLEIIVKCISVYLTLLAYILDCNPVKRFVFQYM